MNKSAGDPYIQSQEIPNKLPHGNDNKTNSQQKANRRPSHINLNSIKRESKIYLADKMGTVGYISKLITVKNITFTFTAIYFLLETIHDLSHFSWRVFLESILHVDKIIDTLLAEKLIICWFAVVACTYCFQLIENIRRHALLSYSKILRNNARRAMKMEIIYSKMASKKKSEAIRLLNEAILMEYNIRARQKAKALSGFIQRRARRVRNTPDASVRNYSNERQSSDR